MYMHVYMYIPIPLLNAPPRPSGQKLGSEHLHKLAWRASRAMLGWAAHATASAFACAFAVSRLLLNEDLRPSQNHPPVLTLWIATSVVGSSSPSTPGRIAPPWRRVGFFLGGVTIFTFRTSRYCLSQYGRMEPSPARCGWPVRRTLRP